MQYSILESNKEKYIELLKSVNRPVIDELTNWHVNETDFFTAPASAKTHGAYEGGLLVHSLSVYNILKNFCKNIPDANGESIIIAALLHDLCKVNFYVKGVRNVKIPGEKRWEEVEVYNIDDSLPLGHGEKSVYMAMKYIRLTDEEALAIRWHMGGYDDSARGYAGGISQSSAYTKYPLAAALAIADMYDTYIIDQRSSNR